MTANRLRLTDGAGQVVLAAIFLAFLGMLSGCGNINIDSPTAPSSFLLTAPTDSSTISGVAPTLRWTNSTGETRYYVEIDDDPAFATPYTTIVTADRTSYSVLSSLLTPSTKYYWRVRAINSAGPTTASNAPYSFLTTLPTSSSPGFELRLPYNGVSNVGVTPTLVWGDAADETLYYVEIDLDPAFTTKFTATVPADTTSYMVPVSTLTASTTYYWQIRAITPSGPVTAPNAPFSFTTAPVITLPSFDLTAPVSGATITAMPPTLEWTDITGETGYLVQISTDPAFSTYFNFDPVAANTTSLLVTAASYSLTPGTQYYWQVLATFGGSGPIKAANAPFSFTP